MFSIPEKFKNLLLYAGIGRQDYLAVYRDITESNRRNLIVFSAVVAAGMLVMLLASTFDYSLVKNRAAYLFCMILCAVLFLLVLIPAKKRPWLTYVSIYVFIGLLYGFGIVLGTFVEPNEVTVSFAVILFAAPLLFTDKPIRMILAILVSILVYLYAASITQDPVMQGYNRSNILPYGVISMIISTYMMQIKVRRHVLEHENRYLIESDRMTGLLNRRSYEQHIGTLRQDGCAPGMKVCAFDINGLKDANDNIGHFCGDALIRGAAACIEQVFSPYGTCYRTGGDEFVAILDPGAPASGDLWQRLSQACRNYKITDIPDITDVPELSVSMGLAAAEQGADIDALVREADRMMYHFKAEYYSRAGISRRTSGDIDFVLPKD